VVTENDKFLLQLLQWTGASTRAAIVGGGKGGKEDM